MKKYIIMAIIAVILFSSNAECASHMELSQRLIVQMAGFDYDKEKETYTVTVSYFSGAPSESKESGSSIMTSDGKGSSLSQALNETELNSGKALMLGECRVIILGEGMRDINLFETIKIFTNEYENQPKMLMVSSKGDAKDLVKIKYENTDIANQQISRIIEEASIQGIANKTTLCTMLIDLYDVTGSTGMPLLESEKTGTDKTSDGKEIKLAGGNLYRDGKFVSETTLTETSGLQWLRNECSNSAKFTIPIKNSAATIDFRHVKTSLYPAVTENGTLKVTVRFKAEAEYIENHIDSNTKYNVEKAELTTEQEVRERLTAAFKKAINENSSDVIGLSRSARSKIYDFFRTNEKNWDNVLRSAEVEIEPEITINRHGVVW